EGRPERWTNRKAGDAIEPPPPGGPAIEIRRITGPIRHVSGDTWELAFNRASFLEDRRGNEAWLAAVWPGDGVFKRAIQQAMLSIPRRHGSGAPQRIRFDAPETWSIGEGDLTLRAESDSGLPVRFFVREG